MNTVASFHIDEFNDSELVDIQSQECFFVLTALIEYPINHDINPDDLHNSMSGNTNSVVLASTYQVRYQRSKI